MVRIYGSNVECSAELPNMKVGDVVVAPDSQERCGKLPHSAWLVFVVVDDTQERVHQRGLFWHKDVAAIFAEAYAAGLEARARELNDKKVRCVVCRAEFSDAEIDAAFKASKQGCPACGDEGLPMAIEQDMALKINWHELRILTIWADNYARERKSDPGMAQTVAAIIKPLEMQRPDGSYAPLTIMGEMQELANSPIVGGDVEVVEPDGTRTTIKKKPVQ